MPDDEGEIYESEAREFAAQSLDQINVQRVPSGVNQIDRIPVDIGESYNRNIKLIGCSVKKMGIILKILLESGVKPLLMGRRHFGKRLMRHSLGSQGR